MRLLVTTPYLRIATVCLTLLSLVACNPVYVMRAAYEQSKILVARRPLNEVIDDPQTDSEDKVKLLLVARAREFTKTMALEPGETFTAYTKLENDPAAWVVSASRKDAFEPHTWWFPIVGSIPYKGFFDKEDALSTAASLEKSGNEVWVRGTAAFSTLGWFNDPLLSSTLKLSAVDVINTVIHETVHSTIWVPGSVAFNESLANYVGNRAAVDFLSAIVMDENSPVSEERRQQLLAQSKAEFEMELDISDSFGKVYEGLSVLYKSELSSEQKITQRDDVFNREFSDFRTKYPDFPILLKVNNAEIMQRKLYLTKLRKFDNLFIKSDSNWTKFIEQIKTIREKAGEEEAAIFDLLDKDFKIQ